MVFLHIHSEGVHLVSSEENRKVAPPVSPGQVLYPDLTMSESMSVGLRELSGVTMRQSWREACSRQGEEGVGLILNEALKRRGLLHQTTWSRREKGGD